MASYLSHALNTWAEFVAAIDELQAEQTILRANIGPRIPDLLFRGQRDASWTLDTTLERYHPASLSLMHYYSSIWAAKTQIEAHTAQRWEIDNLRSYLEKTTDSDAGLSLLASPPAYDYMAYLRHHGFPSPLLDWSRSPYVAAFFAFREAVATVADVAIFAYREQSGAGKVGMAGAPAIDVRGPYVRTHRRHFIQQCQYTVCTVFKDPGPQWHYTSHHDVFRHPGASGGLMFGKQDQLWKFTLPSSERNKVLSYLDEHNLNAYSLFGNEEALMEMMAHRELL